jgi:hypothetical protein
VDLVIHLLSIPALKAQGFSEISDNSGIVMFIVWEFASVALRRMKNYGLIAG